MVSGRHSQSTSLAVDGHTLAPTNLESFDERGQDRRVIIADSPWHPEGFTDTTILPNGQDDATVTVRPNALSEHKEKSAMDKPRNIFPGLIHSGRE